GKGGFRLSLFGYDPAKDYAAVTRGGLARRLTLVDPDNSLLLLKATGQVEHGGGMRFSKGSWQYRIFRQWIEQGTVWREGSGTVDKIVLNPPEVTFQKASEIRQVQVSAKFVDGTKADITAFCD